MAASRAPSVPLAIEMVRRLAINNALANLRLQRACARLEPEAYAAPRTSFFPSIPQTLNHILIVDWYYVDALERGGKGQSVFDSAMPFPDFSELVQAQREVDKRLLAFTDRLVDEKALEEPVLLQRRDHTQVERVVDVLMHLSTHAMHHRGQVHAMLAGTDVKPPQLDEFFMREELPLREGELRELGLPIE